MSVEKLSLKGFIREVVDVSVGAHSRKFCFVLGAGCSITSGIKSGQQLVDIWETELLERNADDYKEWKKSKGISDTNKYEHYSAYYEKRFHRRPADGYNFMEKLMENATPNVGYVILAHILTHTKHNVVITTNFDHLVEDAMSYYTRTLPLVIGHEALSHYISVHINRPTIIKIHRDLLYDPKSTPDQLETLHSNWEEVLDTVFSEYHPVFIGYAGNDNSLMNYLTENSKQFEDDKWLFPYWFTIDDVGTKVLSFLDSANGYLIKFSGFDELLYRLGAELGYELPQKEVFLKDVEKRYTMLADRFNEFTEKFERMNELAADDNKNAESDDISDNSDDTDMTRAIARVTQKTEALRLYRDAIIAHNAGNYDAALQIEKKLVEMEPSDARYRYTLGVTLHVMKRFEEALDEKRRALELDPDNARYHDSLGVTLHVMKRFEEALDETWRALELDPDNAQYHDNLSSTLHEMKRYEEALDETRRALKLEPDNAQYHDSLGVTLHEMKRFEEALDEKRRALKLDPDNARYHNSLSNTLRKMRHYDEALTAARRALELEPDNKEYQSKVEIIQDEMKKDVK